MPNETWDAPWALVRGAQVHGVPGADALVSFGERIVAVGNATALAEKFPVDREYDFGDAALLPGFNDAHLHPAMVAEDLLHLDAASPDITSFDQLIARIEAAVHTKPVGDWIRVSRYDSERFADGRELTRQVLDAIAPDHPVLAVHVSSHWGIVNSLGLARAGVDASTPDPRHGAFGRDADGALDGRVYEQALFDFAYPSMAVEGHTFVPASSFAQRLDGLGRALDLFHAAGLTSLGDAMVGPADLALYQAARARNRLTARLNLLVIYRHLEKFVELGLLDGFGDNRLRIGGIKAFVDGAVAGRTCMVSEAFIGTDDHGMQTLADDELTEVVDCAQRAGMRLAVHANGDRAIALLLDRLELASAKHPRPGLRHRIEHASIINDDLVARMAALGAIAVPFAGYVAFHGDKLNRWYGQDRTSRMFAHRSLLDGGVTVAGSSDYPCGPYEPLLGIQSCVTRLGLDGAQVGIEQRITIDEAIDMFTVGSALATGEQRDKGRLVRGHLADVVVLAQHPSDVHTDEIAQIPVLATIVGGEPVWQRD
ncbi:MAG: amidohydrolase [Dehalococcoidia bacterium]